MVPQQKLSNEKPFHNSVISNFLFFGKLKNSGKYRTSSLEYRVNNILVMKTEKADIRNLRPKHLQIQGF